MELVRKNRFDKFFVYKSIIDDSNGTITKQEVIAEIDRELREDNYSAEINDALRKYKAELQLDLEVDDKLSD